MPSATCFKNRAASCSSEVSKQWNKIIGERFEIKSFCNCQVIHNFYKFFRLFCKQRMKRPVSVYFKK